MTEPNADICMIYDERGNALDAFDYTPEELERRALDLRKARGEITTVTYGPSPFIAESSGGTNR